MVWFLHMSVSIHIYILLDSQPTRFQTLKSRPNSRKAKDGLLKYVQQCGYGKNRGQLLGLYYFDYDPVRLGIVKSANRRTLNYKLAAKAKAYEASEGYH